MRGGVTRTAAADQEPSSILRQVPTNGGYLAKSTNMMRHASNKPASPALGIFSPLRYAVFRRIWTASLLSNLGLLVLGVGAPLHSSNAARSSFSLR